VFLLQSQLIVFLADGLPSESILTPRKKTGSSMENTGRETFPNVQIFTSDQVVPAFDIRHQ
jgi:hypothetical protein